MKLETFILNRVSYKESYSKIFPDYLIPGPVLCPFHKDTNPSLNIREDGSAYCYGCKRYWKNLIEFYCSFYNCPKHIGIFKLYSKYIEPLLGRGVYLKYCYQLDEDSKAYLYLIDRGIGDRTIRRLYLGLDIKTNRITLPIFNEYGYCINIRLFNYAKDKELPKVCSYKKGFGKPRLFPLTSLQHKEAYIFEGEMDTMLAIHLGLNAVTSTGGASGWRREFTGLFKDKVVYICMDNDKAGMSGAQQISKELKGVAEKIYPIFIPTRFGKDFTEYMQHRPLEAFLDLIAKTREVSPRFYRGITKLKGIDRYENEETMIVDLKPGKQTLHIIVKVESDEGEVRFS